MEKRAPKYFMLFLAGLVFYIALLVLGGFACPRVQEPRAGFQFGVKEPQAPGPQLRYKKNGICLGPRTWVGGGGPQTPTQATPFAKLKRKTLRS